MIAEWIVERLYDDLPLTPEKIAQAIRNAQEDAYHTAAGWLDQLNRSSEAVIIRKEVERLKVDGLL